MPPEGSVLGRRQSRDVTETTDTEEVVRWATSESGGDGVRADAGDGCRTGGLAGGRGGGPVVALVRDGHRHGWVVETLRRLTASVPHLVVVEMGWPGTERLPGGVTVRTYGSARVNGEALDAVLAGALGEAAR
jgi:beta-N-acetylhexosaminidase